MCTVYRSRNREGLYLYVDKRDGLDKVPAELLQRFGPAELAMSLRLTAERKLARTNGSKVIAAIEQQGYFLQLPPAPDTEMAQLARLNSKLSL